MHLHISFHSDEINFQLLGASIVEFDSISEKDMEERLDTASRLFFRDW